MAILDLGAAGDARTARLVSALGDLAERGDAIAELAGREVDAARVEMRAVESLAERHGAALAPVVAQLRAERGASGRGMGQLLLDQTARTAAFLGRSRERLARTRDATRESLRLASELGDISRAIHRISFDAALLSLNAQIASARIGAIGGAASVIAARMRALAGEIASSNQALTRVAADVATALPEIDAAVARTEALAGDYARDAERLQADVEGAFEALRAEVEGVAESGSARASLVRREAAAVLRHLGAHDAIDPLLARISQAARDAAAEATEGPLDATAVEAWREATAGDVERAASHSLEHIGPIVAALTSLNEGARAHVEELTAICARLDDASETGRSDAGLAGLAASLGTFTDAIGAGAREQASALAATTARARSLVAILNETQAFALEATMIGITTKIESARLDRQGDDFRNIGLRLVELNEAIREALGRGFRLSRSIDAALLSMRAAVSENELAISEFARDQAAAFGEYRRAAERATGAARAAVVETRQRADQMLTHCFQAIVHFQFQDRITQELGAIERLAGAIARLAGCLHGADADEASRAIAAVPTFLEASRDAAAVDGEGDLSSGDMLMF